MRPNGMYWVKWALVSSEFPAIIGVLMRLRIDGVDANSEAREFEGGAPRHPAYGPFAGGIGELARYGAHRRDRRDVDD